MRLASAFIIVAICVFSATPPACAFERGATVVVIRGDAPVVLNGQVVLKAVLGEELEVIDSQPGHLFVGHRRLGWIDANDVLSPVDAAREFTERIKRKETAELLACLARVLLTIDNLGLQGPKGERSLEFVAASCKRSLKLDSNNLVALSARSDLFRKYGQNEKALADANRMAALAPQNMLSFRTQGVVHEAMGNFQQAIADFKKAEELDGQNNRLRLKRAQLLMQTGEISAGFALVDDVIARDPYFDAALMVRADAHLRQQHFDEAIRDCTKYIDDSHDPIGYFARASAWRKKGDFGKAMDDLNRLIATNKAMPQAWYQRAKIYLAKNEFESALGDSTEMLRLFPPSVYAYEVRALAHAGLGERDAALADVERMIAIDPKFAAGYALRAELHKIRGEHKLAEIDLLRARALDPSAETASLPRVINQNK